MSVEELKNRVIRLQRELDLEYDELNRGDELILALEEDKYLQNLQHEDAMMLVRLRNAVEQSKKRDESLQNEIEWLRIDTLRLKGALRSLATSKKTTQRETQPFNLVRAFWMNTSRK